MYKFGPISDRVRRVREKYRTTTPYVDTTRYRIVTDFYMQHQELTGILKRAYNFKNLCEKMPCTIFEDDAVVGVYVQTYRASAMYPENSIDFIIDELKNNTLDQREVDPYLITEEDREYIPVKSNHTASPLQEEQPTTVFTGTEALKSAESAADKPNRHPDRPDLPPSQLRGKGKAAVSLFKPRDSRPPFILGVVLTTVKVAAIALVIA